jgi:hypothetical protein
MEEGNMPTLTIPDETFRRLTARAAELHITVDQLVTPFLDRAAEALPTEPLTGEAWRRAFDRLTREIQSRAGRYPSGHIVDDSRESIYRDREDAQL